MKIADKTVVQMHYTLTSDEGRVIDSSEGRDPLQYIQGMHMIVAGLEKAMYGHEVGDKFNVKVIPAEGYGIYDERMTQVVPANVFQCEAPLEVGMQFYAQTPAGPMPIRIKSIDGDKVTIDANHELAGQNLNFAIEVVEVREATAEDLAPFQQHHCKCGKGDGCCHGEGDGECECGGEGECKCGGEGHGDGECCCKNKDAQ